jgi:Kef-type K+ transport system membrane component KefB
LNLLLLLILGGLMEAVRSFTVGSMGSGGTSLAFGYLLLTAYFAGGIFHQLRLPRLTGYIAAGIVVGPAVLGLLNESMVGSLELVNGMAVAMIALTAGTELELRAMRPLLRSIFWLTLTAVIGTAVVLTGAIVALRGSLPFLAELGLPQALAIAAVLAVVMVAQSPAVVVALRNEMRADGPVTRTVLGVVVIADLVVIFLFAVTSSVARSALGGSADMLASLGTIAWELLGSLVVGSLMGGVLALYLRKVQGGAAMFLLTVAFIMAEVGQRLHFDPLLLALAAGVVVRNASDAGDELHRQIDTTALPLYVLFFAVAGATLHLDALALVGLPALFFVAVRAAGFLVGARVGARLADAPEPVRRWAGLGLLPQAGLALALSALFAKTFPELGEHACALTLGVVAINEMVAPALYRLALVRSGEAGKRQSTAPAAEPPHGAEMGPLVVEP